MENQRLVEQVLQLLSQPLIQEIDPKAQKEMSSIVAADLIADMIDAVIAVNEMDEELKA